MAVSQPFQEQTAAMVNVIRRLDKVARIPWIGHIPRRFIQIQQTTTPPFPLRPQNPLHIADVGGVHADEEVIVPCVLPPKPHRAVGNHRHSPSPQFRQSPRMDAVANLLFAGGGGGYHDVPSSRRRQKRRHHGLRHGRTANVPMAHEHQPPKTVWSGSQRLGTWK